MADLAVKKSSTTKKVSVKNNNGGRNNNNGGYSSKTVYDDVFGGPPKYGVPSLNSSGSSQIDDYNEIFGSFNSSRVSSIPILDLPVVDEKDVSIDVRSSKFDYSEVFGGFDNGLDFAVSYEELLAQEPKGGGGGESSSDDAWTSAETGSPSEGSSEDPGCSETHQSFSNEESYESDGIKQFNVLYQKSNQIGRDDDITATTHIARLNSVPAFTFLVDESIPSQKAEKDNTLDQVFNSLDLDIGDPAIKGKDLKEAKSDKPVYDDVAQISEFDAEHLTDHLKETISYQPFFPAVREPSENGSVNQRNHLKETISHLPVSHAVRQNSEGDSVHPKNHLKDTSLSQSVTVNHIPERELEPQGNPGENASRQSKGFVTVSEINLRTNPCHVPPPSRPPPKVSIWRGDSKTYTASHPRASGKHVLQRAVSDGSPQFFDVEVDASSSAEASAAAMKEAMDFAQARLKSAKELMERKKDGLQNRKKMGLKDESKFMKRREWETAPQAPCSNEKLNKTSEHADKEIKGHNIDEMAKAPRVVEVDEDRQVTGEKLVDASEEMPQQNHVEETGTTQASHGGEEEIGEWKVEEQYYELVQTVIPRPVVETSKHESMEDSESSQRESEVAHDGSKTAARELHLRGEYEMELNVAPEVSSQEINDNRYNQEPEKEDHEKKLKESNDESVPKVELTHVLENNVQIQKEEFEKREKMAREREEQEKSRLEEAREQEENERRQIEENERIQIEENERMQIEAREREESEKRLKECREREEEAKRLKEAHELEEKRQREEDAKRLKEAQELEEKRQCEAREHEKKENERRLKEEFEREEAEKKLKEALEKEVNEKKMKETREKEEKERRLRESLEREENDRRLREVCEKEEFEKRQAETRAREEEERRVKEAREQEENERRLQELKREENEKNLKAAQEAREQEESMRRQLELKREENEKNVKAAQEAREQEENKRRQQELKREENEKAAQEAREQEENKRQRELKREENEKNVKAAQEVLVHREGEGNPKASSGSLENADNGKREKADGKACRQDEDKNLNATREQDTGKNFVEVHAVVLQEKTERSKIMSQGALEQEENNCAAQRKKQLVENGRKVEAAHPTNNLEKKHKTESLSVEEREKEKRVQREREREIERLRKVEEDREREREREKDRMAVERATREARERALADARERAERAAVERATAEARQRAVAEARERLDRASAVAREKSVAEKSYAEGKIRAERDARLRLERAAVERATAEARERAAEKLKADKSAFGARERTERTYSEKYSSTSRDSGIKHSSSFSDLRDTQHQSSGASNSFQRYPNSSNQASNVNERYQGAEIVESAQRCKARLERHQRTVERAAKALAEKNMRDLLAQREQAERNRFSDTLDADVRRWSNGKEGNLRALLSTLQYILGPDSGWHPVPLTEVITAVAVKKAYRKATLCVHPDKLQQRGATIQQKYICEKVFDLLKEAWNKFNSEER